ncbi:SGNH/GDSL hydrolase family protein [Nocardiopsis sp. YSL2]|uniref:SGNH/GDSL hydrolase family protein n=1 Tax=Nocardiopsis sp. YSL2 TaxID=2939492 RepID=UPI0026F449E1|nr:SGNH/GDSL hydrolase family protein [Nocardiopsis sp. YSL2]
MARHLFGGIADYVITLGADNAATLQPGAAVTAWNASSGGAQYTDLTDTDGVTEIPGGELTADAVGAVQEFMGPDEVRSVYLDANAGAGPRRRAVAIDIGEDLTMVSDDLSTHTSEANPHGTGVATLADAAADPGTSDVKGGSSLSYDTETATWRPDGSTTALMGWHASLANRHFARANVVCVGDSITEGQGATDYAHTWPARLRELLRARFPTAGVTGGRGFIGAASTGSISYTWPATVTGGPTYDTGWGPKRHTPFLDGDGTPDLITYSALQGTAVDILWGRSSLSGTFRYRVDGGAWTSVDTSGTSQDGQLTRVTLGTSGPHTLEIEAVTAAFKQIVSGVIEYDGDEAAGVTVHDASHFGWESTTWSTPTDADKWPSAIGALNPGLIVIMLGANDQWAGTAPSTFRTNVSALIAALRGANTVPVPFPPILLAMHAARGDGPFAHTWDAYVAEAHSLARTDPLVTVADLTLGPRMPDQADSPNWGLYADQVHLSGKGYAYLADRLADILSPR